MNIKYCRDALNCAQRPTHFNQGDRQGHPYNERITQVGVSQGDRQGHPYNERITQNVFQSFIIFMVISLIGGGFALLIGGRLTAPTSARQTGQLISSGDLRVVGPPSLPAATVDAIFWGLGSPMAGTGKLVEQTSRQANIDDAFALAVWWKETNDGETGVGLTNHNPGGVRDSTGYPSAYSYTLYPGYAAAIVDWFHILHIRYIDYGLNTVYAISHPYVGTSNSPSWAAKVVALMLQYRGEAPPPPTPTAAPSPTIAPQMLPHHKIVIDPGVTRVSQPQKGTQRPTVIHTLSLGVKMASTSAPALSPTIEWLIVALALMLAIAVALWARSLSVGAGVELSGEGTLVSPAVGIAKLTQGNASIPSLTPTPVTPLVGVTTFGLTPPPFPFWGEAREPHNNPAPTPTVLRLPSRPPVIPHTETLRSFVEPPVVPDTNSLQPFPRLPVTQGNGKFRRTILLPSQPGTQKAEMPEEEMAKVNARPPGLLARYGKTQQG